MKIVRTGTQSNTVDNEAEIADLRCWYRIITELAFLNENMKSSHILYSW